MTTLLQAGGSWNATPTSVDDGTWLVVASAQDPAGNVGSARQTLTKDTTTPPETDLEITDAGLKARKMQSQRKRVKVVARASAGEPVDLVAKAKVRIKGKRKAIKLRPVRESAETDQSVRLVLKPAKKKHRREILRALRAGKEARARISVLFRDTAGNKRVLRAAIELR